MNAFFAPTYFGGLGFPVVAGVDPTPAADRQLYDGEPVESTWQVIAWMADTLRSSGIFARESVTIGRLGNTLLTNCPRAWIIPVGFNDRMDSAELATRTANIAVNLSVPWDRDDPTGLSSYVELDALERDISLLLEPGPPGVNLSLGGLLKGTFDSPAGQKQNAITPLDANLAITLVYAYAFDRAVG